MNKTDRERYIKDQRWALVKTMGRAKDRLEPFEEEHDVGLYQYLDANQTGLMADAFADLAEGSGVLARELGKLPISGVSKAVRERLGKVIASASRASKLLEGGLTEQELNLANRRTPPSALVLAFGNPKARSPEGRRGMYGQARVQLLHAATNLFYVTEPLPVTQVVLTEREWRAWQDPLTYEVKEASQDQARELAARRERFIEVLSPTREVVFWASPYGAVPDSPLKGRQGRAAAFSAKASRMHRNPGRSDHEMLQALWYEAT